MGCCGGGYPGGPVGGAGYNPYPCHRNNNGFVLIVVLFILLIIVGTAFAY